MTDPLSEYQAGRGPIPGEMLAWQVFGRGLENVGRDGRPLRIPVPRPQSNELLARVDAAGLCFSDIKILKLGNEHPRLSGRNLADNPIILGHEASVTIVEVGEDLWDKFSVGDRFVIQAEIYYQGKNLAFGYLLAGALEQYVLLGDEILRGDEGLYMIPVRPEAGYAETALAEPWACVVHSYTTDFRRTLLPGGVAWIIAADAGADYTLGELAQASSGPARIVATNVTGDLQGQIEAATDAWGAELKTVDLARPEDAAQVQSQQAAAGFDDIVIIGRPATELVAAAAATLGKYGTLALVLEAALPGPVPLDISRIHYDYVRYVGTSGDDISEAYTSSRDPHLKPEGKALLIGGAGPMGQMHLQLALESKQGPQLVVVTDIDEERLSLTADRFSEVARQHNKQLFYLNPQQLGDEYDKRLSELAPGGFDDIVLLVPSAPLALGATQYLADTGMMNMFAGIPRGTIADVDLNLVARRGVRFTGTSGSRIEDLETTVRMTETGELSPNRSVAAIGGIEAAHNGLRAVRDGLMPGKIVIYPQIEGLPLTALPDLSARLPEVAAHLGPGNTWTHEAEAQLLRQYLAKVE